MMPAWGGRGAAAFSPPQRPPPRRPPGAPPHRLGVKPDLPAVLLEPPRDLHVRLEVDDRPPRTVLQEGRIHYALDHHIALEFHPNRALAPAPAGPRGVGGTPQQRVGERARGGVDGGLHLLRPRTQEPALEPRPVR